MQLTNLPGEIHQEIALLLSYNDILTFCQVNRQIYTTICQDETFWRSLCRRYFHHQTKPPALSWRQHFNSLNSNQVWTCGDAGYSFKRIHWQLTKLALKYTKVAIGHNHCLFLDINGDVWGKGDNYNYELGLPEEKDYIGITKLPCPKAIDIGVGLFHSAIIDTRNRVWVVGSNELGQIGIDQRMTTKFTRVLHVPFDGSDLKFLEARKLICNNYSTAVIDFNHQAWVATFGASLLHYGFDVASLYKSNGFYRLPGPPLKDLVFGECFTLAIGIDNQLYLGGVILSSVDSQANGIPEQDKNTLKYPHETNIQAIKVASNNFSHYVIDTDNNLLVIGENAHWLFSQVPGNQLGLGETREVRVFTPIPNLKAIDIAVSNSHTVVIDVHHNIWVTGSNQSGQLGLGNNVEATTTFTQITNFKANRVSVNHNSTFFVSNEF